MCFKVFYFNKVGTGLLFEVTKVMYYKIPEGKASAAELNFLVTLAITIMGGLPSS